MKNLEVSMLVLNHSVLCTYLLCIGNYLRQTTPMGFGTIHVLYSLYRKWLQTEILYDYTCVTWSFIDSVYRYIVHSVGSGLGRTTLYKVQRFFKIGVIHFRGTHVFAVSLRNGMCLKIANVVVDGVWLMTCGNNVVSGMCIDRHQRQILISGIDNI